MGGLSSSLVVIRLWVRGICFLSTKGYKLKEVKIFRLCIIVLRVLSVMYYVVRNWFVLYFFFEASLFPILMLVLG